MPPSLFAHTSCSSLHQSIRNTHRLLSLSMLLIPLHQAFAFLMYPTNQESNMFRIGEWVGSGLWANRLSHPNDWGRPHFGQVLDLADGQAWANSTEFPVPVPDLGAVMTHVLREQAQGKLKDIIPVRWEFVRGLPQVRWHKISSLRSKDDEYALWKALRAQELDRRNHPRRRTSRPLSDFLPESFLHLAR